MTTAMNTPVRRKRKNSLLSRRDRGVLAVMAGIPTAIHIAFIWVPAVLSILLSFTKWNGVKSVPIKWVGFKNYRSLFSVWWPDDVWPAIKHNLIWLLAMTIATMIGLLLAVLLDKNIKGSRVYQSVLYLPVVLSLAVVGFMWQLIYRIDDGFINQFLGTSSKNGGTDWLGNSDINLYSILVAAAWRHVGYIMVLFLAGLKAVDPTLREAASIDGASEPQTFFRVILPALKPINIVVMVVTVIESLRAFDLVYIASRGSKGTKLFSNIVYDNIVGETRRVGFGSAAAVLMLLVSTGFIFSYLWSNYKESR